MDRDEAMAHHVERTARAPARDVLRNGGRSHGCGGRRIVLAVISVALATTGCGDDDAASPVRFCEIQSEINQLPDDFSSVPAEARDSLRQLAELGDAAAEVAPDDIRSAAQGLADNFDSILAVWEAAEFDVAQLDESALSAAYRPQFADFDAVRAWVATNCS